MAHLTFAAWLQGYPPWVNIGAEVSHAELMEAFVARGHRAVVIGPMSEPTVRNGVELFPHPDMCASPQHRRQLGAEAVAVLVGNFGPGRPNPYWSAARTLGCPVGVMLSHNSYPVPEGVRFSVANSDWVKEAQGCDIRIHPPVLSEHWIANEGSRSAVTIVGTSREKGIETFLAVAPHFPDVPFIAVRNWYRSQLHEVETSLANVRVLGARTTEEMPAVYGDTQILLVPSESESYGRVCVEAMLNGCHVIAADLPGIREACGRAATYLDPSDHDAWVSAVHDRLGRGPSLLSLSRAEHVTARTHREIDEFIEFLRAL